MPANQRSRSSRLRSLYEEVTSEHSATLQAATSGALGWVLGIGSASLLFPDGLLMALAQDAWKHGHQIDALKSTAGAVALTVPFVRSLPVNFGREGGGRTPRAYLGLMQKLCQRGVACRQRQAGLATEVEHSRIGAMLHESSNELRLC